MLHLLCLLSEELSMTPVCSELVQVPSYPGHVMGCHILPYSVAVFFSIAATFYTDVSRK